MSNESNRRNSPNKRNLPNRLNRGNGEDKGNGPDQGNGQDQPNGPIQDIKRNRNGKSTVSRAHPTSPSLRTTIPRHIIEILDWNSGDVLSWEIEKRGDKYYVIIRRLE